jgi:hypothetical protein
MFYSQHEYHTHIVTPVLYLGASISIQCFDVIALGTTLMVFWWLNRSQPFLHTKDDLAFSQCAYRLQLALAFAELRGWMVSMVLDHIYIQCVMLPVIRWFWSPRMLPLVVLAIITRLMQCCHGF